MGNQLAIAIAMAFVLVVYFHSFVALTYMPAGSPSSIIQ